MKKTSLIPAVVAALVCGCNTVHQEASVKITNPNGTIEERTVRSDVKTRGDAKAAVEKMNGGATSKSAHIGAAGVSEESNITDTIQAISKLLQDLTAAGVAAGAKAAKPVP